MRPSVVHCLQALDCRVMIQEPLSLHTTMGVGGSAKIWVEPTSAGDLARVIEIASKESIPWFVVGNGSNVVFSDKGFDGIILHLAGDCFKTIQYGQEGMIVGAGCQLQDVVRFCVREGVTGLEFLAGIPGTVGGALKMNAGAYGKQISDAVTHVRCMDTEGRQMILSKESIQFSYRGFSCKELLIFLECAIHVGKTEPRDVEQRVNKILSKRTTRHPRGFSAGSVFKNPRDAAAWRLIDQAGLRGACVGDAVVSSKHANFIINRGKARSSDIRELIQTIQDGVRQQCRVELEPEIEFVN